MQSKFGPFKEAKAAELPHLVESPRSANDMKAQFCASLYYRLSALNASVFDCFFMLHSASTLPVLLVADANLVWPA
jgi:hypothetical protein